MSDRPLKKIIKCLVAALPLLGMVFMFPVPVRAADYSDAEIIRGFNSTVFGSEYAPFGIKVGYIHKFNGPVNFYIHDLGSRKKGPQVKRFILSLNHLIYGLKTRVVAHPSQANFNVYIVDRKDYKAIARSRVYKRPDTGKCMVRSVFTPWGIKRSDAIIVSDEGDRLFNRCKVEEILQGLGPLNDDPTLGNSVFNDSSSKTGFTRYDRYILNLLYDRRISNGATKRQVQKLLPHVLKDVRRRIKGAKH